MTRWWLAAVLVTACERPPIDSCSEDLTGVWTTPLGTRWMVLDHGTTLEGFPMFDDSTPDGAPRVIDLARTDRIAGTVKRRFIQRANTCVDEAPVTVTACKANTLQLVVTDPATPLAFGPCRWPASTPARVETWRRLSEW